MHEIESRSEAILRAHERVLAALGQRAPLDSLLTVLVREAEAILTGMRCSVLLLENGLLKHGAAPSLPAEYTRLIDGLAIGPDAGSCGAAAYSRQRVVARDVLEHPNWQEFRHLVPIGGFRACWSEPILVGPKESTKDVLGTFAMYYPEPRDPQDFEIDFIRSMAQIAGIAIQGARVDLERRLNEARMRQIIDLDPNMLFVKDWDGRFLLANEAVAQAFGLTVEELMQRPHRDVHRNPDEVEQMLADDREVMTSGRPKFIPEEFLVDVDGRRRVLQTTKIPYTLAGEGVRAVLGVAVDITESKRVEEWLRQSEERFRQLAEAIREVFWLTDWDTNKVLYVSPAYEAIWGHPCSELYEDSKSWSSAVHPEDHGRVVETFAREGPMGGYDVEYRIVRPDGEVRWIHDRAFPIRDENGHVYRVAGLSEDVTRRKVTELELECALAELDARSRARLRSLQSDLLWAEERERRRLAVDLHDGLNQLLTLSLMKLGALERAVPEDVRGLVTEVADLVDEANRSARSLTFRLSPPVLHDLGFEPAVQWLAEDVQRSYELPVELIGADGPPTPMEERLRVLLFRAVRELLINVAKHAGATRARVTLERSAEDLWIEVFDDGVAFDARAVGRRGWGLSSIRERLESFGGRMHIESAPATGTRIRLKAPLVIPRDEDDPNPYMKDRE